MSGTLEISKRSNIKGDDGYKVFSVRIKKDIVLKLDEISQKTNRSRNELINTILEFEINNGIVISERE